MNFAHFALAGTALALFSTGHVHAQSVPIIGSYDNFDCFDDAGEAAEGFEIDVEDIQPSDVTRIFPDNFPANQPYIRYATPDRTKLTLVTFPDGHTGVSIIYAAHYVNGTWQTRWGNSTMPGGGPALGNATPYVANPTTTTGESCWTLGLGAAYPTSGCDHFGISLSGNVVPGKITYHWLVPDKVNPGQLVQAGTVAGLPPSPVLTPKPPVVGKPPVVHAVAEAPEQPERAALNQYSDAFWLRTYTSYSPKPANLDALQQNLVPVKNKLGVRVTATWALVQRTPPGVAGEKAEVEDDPVGGKNVQVVKRYEYYQYAGLYDPETHEALCGGDNSCNAPLKKGLNGQNELGNFVGAHMNAYDVK